MATYDLTVSIPNPEDLVSGDILNCPYSGTYKTITLPPGTYKLETWGAEGGVGETSIFGGKGGYSVGNIEITESSIFYLYSGQKGSLNDSIGTFGSGGATKNYTSPYRGGSGGGASDIRINSTSLYARVIVAGGGGGAGNTAGGGNPFGGGAGGSSGIAGGFQTGIGGGGGTQIAGGIGGYHSISKGVGSPGTFGMGGQASYYNGTYYPGGGGGGGWYGGGGSSITGAGGGSSYIYTSSTASNYPSECLLDSSHYLSDALLYASNTSFVDYNGATVTGHSGDGAIRITINEIVPQNITYSYSINWNDDYGNAYDTRPVSIDLDILNSDESPYGTITISSDNDWAGSFEIPDEDLIVEYNNSLLNYTDTNTIGTNTVSITHTMITTSYTNLNSINWKDNNNQFATRPPSVTMNLYINDIFYDSVITSNGLETFSDLPYKNRLGELFVYTYDYDDTTKYIYEGNDIFRGIIQSMYGDKNSGVFLNYNQQKFYKIYLGDLLIIEKGLWLLSSDGAMIAEVDYIWADDKTWVDDYIWVDGKQYSAFYSEDLNKEEESKIFSDYKLITTDKLYT